MSAGRRTASRRWSQTAINLALPLLISLPVLWALLPGGLASTADGQVHFIRSAEMVNAWRQGIYLPRWSENLGFGLGIPLFVYAPPLPYFIASALHWVGLPLEMAFKGMWLIALLTNAFGAFRLTRDSLGLWPGVVSCAALVYAPLHLHELFIQGNAGQYLAWAFLPWVCWSVIQLFRTGSLVYVVAAALAVCGVQLSHHVVALLGAGLAGGLWLFMSIGVGRLRPALLSFAGLLLGLALSAWFWAPALLEVAFIRTDAIAASDFRTRFMTLVELVALSPRLDNGAVNPYFPKTLGAVQAALALGGIGALVALFISSRSADRRPHETPAESRPAIPRPLWSASLYFSFAFIFGALMTLSWSAPVWDALPFLDLFEFPWRWHGMTYVAVGWLAGLVVFASGRANHRLTAPIAAAALFLFILSALVNLYPDKLPPGVYAGSPADVVRYEQRTGQIGTTSLGEFNPRWIEGVLTSSPLVDGYANNDVVNRLPDPMPFGVTGEPLYSSAQRHDFRISAQQPTTLTIDLHYFPGWQAFSNGAPLPIAPHVGSGLIDVALPAGEQTLTLRFGGTPLRRGAELLSLATGLAVMMFLGWRLILTNRPDAHRPDVRHDEPARASAVAVAVVALIVGVLLALRAVGEDRFTFTSPPDQAVTAAVQLRADFADQVRVLGVDLPAALVQPGESIAVTAYLRALQPLDKDYSIFLHLDRPDGETVASAQALHPGDIPTSKWATGLHVRAPLRLTIPADLLPMRYRLRVGVIEPESGEWLPLADGSADVLEIGQVWVDGDSVQTPGGPQARFGEGIQLLGANVDKDSSALRLFWRADQALPENLTIFIHLLDDQGNVTAQLDGVPFDGQYQLSAWRPGQVVEDVRALPSLHGVTQIALGVYDMDSGVRLSGWDAGGARLPNDAVTLQLR